MLAIHRAVEEGDYARVRRELAFGGDVNTVDSANRTPLHWAAERSNPKITELLLKKRADVNAKDRDGMTPLHMAISKGCGVVNDSIETVRVLLDRGADPNAKTFVYNQSGDLGELLMATLGIDPQENGNTPLHFAVHGNPEFVELLLEKGADVNVKSFVYGYGMTPLYSTIKYACRDHKRIAKMLIDNGADMDASGENGNVALHLAACSGNIEIVELLLSQGADVNARDMKGITPLHLAASAYMGGSVIVDMLIAKGADVNASSCLGITPLHAAAASGRINEVRLLVAKGADVNAKDIDGNTPLCLAGSHVEVFDYLKTLERSTLEIIHCLRCGARNRVGAHTANQLPICGICGNVLKSNGNVYGGYIYILINASFEGLVKIGETMRSPEERARELSQGTGIPSPFLVAYSKQVSDSVKAEKMLHQKLDQFRIRSNREFFRISLEEAIKHMEAVAKMFPVI